jgi:hypothetical protein
MAEDNFWTRHGAFFLFTFLVLMGGLYVACSGSVDDHIDQNDDGGTDAPRTNR